MRFSYVCNDCHREYLTDEIFYVCPACSGTENPGEFRKGNLIVKLNDEDLQKFKGELPELFPYPLVNPSAFPVGPTPLAKPNRLTRKYGLKHLLFKLDNLLPSGSFKDRASQMVASQALLHKENKIALASTGNAGAAMSCAGAAYGFEVILFVPENAPVNKLMQSILYGATVVPVKGSYDDAFDLSLYYTEQFGGINRNTAYNPMTVEGKKSVALEIYSQLRGDIPDIIYVPVGDGCIYSGVCKGFLDLKRCGLIERVPRVVCAQSNKSNAIAQAWERGSFKAVTATTLADSISVSSPANGRMAVRYLKETNGWATLVSDEEILEAQMELVRESGTFVEPAAACAWAAAVKDRSKLDDEAKICVLLTGQGFKDMAVFDGRVKLPKAIENSKEAVIERFAHLSWLPLSPRVIIGQLEGAFMKNILIGFAIGAGLMLIILIIQAFKNKARSKAHKEEIARLKAMLTDRMDLESEGLSKLKKEVDELKQQNENMRISLQTFAQKPGRKEVARLQVFQQAVDRLTVNAPGFGAAWQVALKESEGEYEQTLLGVKPFLRKVIPLKNSKTQDEQ